MKLYVIRNKLTGAFWGRKSWGSHGWTESKPKIYKSTGAARNAGAFQDQAHKPFAELLTYEVPPVGEWSAI